MRRKTQYTVLLITTGLGVGGLETYLVRLVKVMDRDVFRPIVVYNKADSETYRNAIESMGIEVLHIATGYSQIQFMGKIKKVMESRGIDIVCDFRGDFAGPTLLVAKLLGICSRVAMYRSSRQGFRESFAKNAYAFVLHKIVEKTATRIIGNTEKVLDVFYPNRSTDARFAVVYNGVDLSMFTKAIDKAAIRASLGIGSVRIVIGHLGRLHKAKNHDVVIEVFRRLHKMLSETQLLLVGDGSLRQRINDRIKTLGLSNCVTLAGQRLDVPEMLGAMDLFIYPSIYEGMPNALVEAMASGLSFVASNIQEISEILPAALHTQLFGANDVAALEDALYQLCTDKKRRDMVGAAAKEWISKNYSIEHSAELLIKHWLAPFDTRSNCKTKFL